MLIFEVAIIYARRRHVQTHTSRLRNNYTSYNGCTHFGKNYLNFDLQDTIIEKRRYLSFELIRIQERIPIIKCFFDFPLIINMLYPDLNYLMSFNYAYIFIQKKIVLTLVTGLKQKHPSFTLQIFDTQALHKLRSESFCVGG